MNFFTTLFLFVFLLGNSQTKITLAKNPYSDNNHGIVLLNNDSFDKENTKYYSIEDGKVKYAWKKLKIEVTKFKSILVSSKENKYDITLQLDADGILKLDRYTTNNNDNILAFVFNDTIYQTKKIKAPILNGKFNLKNLTKKQKNKIVTILKSLPSYDLQVELYEGITSCNTEKIDKALEKGAQLIDGGYKEGATNYRDVIYNLFRDKNSKYKKYSKTIKHLLKRGFTPNSKNIQQAIVFEDIVYVRNFFMSEKNMKKRQKMLNKYAWNSVSNGSLKVFKLIEDLGLVLKEKRKKSLLMKAVKERRAEMVNYFLSKKYPYTAADLLVYLSIYMDIKIFDAIVTEYNLDINSLTKESNSNVAQQLVILYNKGKFFDNELFLKIIPKLIERGLKVNTKNKLGSTILHEVSTSLKYILNYRSAYHEQYNPIREAKELINFIELMKSEGVTINAKDVKGFTAYDYALKDMNRFKVKSETVQKVLNTLK